jgi:4-hydroxy-tetrahydrodipicolinate synthase
MPPKEATTLRNELSLHGIITALLTPFTPDGVFDEESMQEMVQFQIRNGVNGLFVLGTTGTGPVMEPEERKRVTEVVIDVVDRKIPVIVHVGDANPKLTLGLARHAENAGADAVACLTPFYYNPGAEAIITHYKRLTQETNLPVLVYNIPRNTGINVDSRLLLELSKIPNVVGIKDSSRDFSQLLDYLGSVPKGFMVINGTDSYQFSAFCAGTNAGVSATANVVPELFVQMYQAYLSRDLKKGQELQKEIHALRSAMSTPPLAPFLEALKIRGLRSGNVRPPLRSMNSSEIATLTETLARLLPQLSVSR